MQESPFPCYVLPLLLLQYLHCLMNDFNPDILFLVFTDVWKKQRIKFINSKLGFMLKGENHSA
jgi:hypothetical protein